MFSRLAWVILALSFFFTPLEVKANPPSSSTAKVSSVVKLEQLSDGSFRLLRNGEPYFIRGAGVTNGSLEVLVACGGNSIRSWGVDGLREKLIEANRLQLSVCAGLWLGHERHGFDYSNADMVASQTEDVRKAVLEFKDDPAILCWGLGNEMEGDGNNAAIWSHINRLATLVKRLDPNHPTMTVVAEIGGHRVRNIHQLCPEIDIIGINSYSGAASVPNRYRDAGGTKPFILTEFGPPGKWELDANSWGAVPEPTSTEKALAYRRSYRQGILESRGRCLGSYAFAWGSKVEYTATWFGMFLADGTKLAAVDEVTEFWTAAAPVNRCPRIRLLRVTGPEKVEPGAIVEATLDAVDPEGDNLEVNWLLQAEQSKPGTGGDREDTPKIFPDAVMNPSATTVKVRMPESPGGYRLFAFVRDRDGGAVGNIPLFVECEPSETSTD